VNGAQVRNMQQVRPEVERQQAGAARPGRVCLSDVQRARKARRAARRRRKQIIAVIALWMLEVLGAALAGGVAAAIMLPVAFRERGYFAYGAEWLIIFAVAILAYHIIHRAVFLRLERQ